MTTAAPAAAEPSGKVMCLFDFDGTLTLPRQRITAEMRRFLHELRAKPHVTIGIVTGSCLSKISKQYSSDNNGDAGDVGDNHSELLAAFDYVFLENGLHAFRDGRLVGEESIEQRLGQPVLQPLINFVLAYLGELRLPVKRGCFVEFRKGLINISPIGRACSLKERLQFHAYDRKHRVREKMVAALKERFAGDGLSFSIGGQISIDAFPHGWDKSFCLRFLEPERFEKIYFFGDQTCEGGNDYSLFWHAQTVGHTVTSPGQTRELVSKLGL